MQEDDAMRARCHQHALIAARHAGLEVLGVSCITNMASGILQQALSHEEVMETADRVKSSFLDLVMDIIPKI